MCLHVAYTSTLKERKPEVEKSKGSSLCRRCLPILASDYILTYRVLEYTFMASGAVRHGWKFEKWNGYPIGALQKEILCSVALRGVNASTGTGYTMQISKFYHNKYICCVSYCHIYSTYIYIWSAICIYTWNKTLYDVLKRRGIVIWQHIIIILIKSKNIVMHLHFRKFCL